MVSTVTNYAKHQLSQNTTWAAKASWCVDDAGTTMVSTYGIACPHVHISIVYNTMYELCSRESATRRLVLLRI